MSQTKPSTKQVLPSKEASLFKSLVKYYEQKQYRRGIKTADSILKKFPTHGETMAMKGLILNSLEKKEEAYDYVRRGLKQDLTSHVSWHVYGLLYRSDREYNEAIKCYRNALRNSKDNGQILRDLSMLQVHLRDIEGYMETRRQLLMLEPARKAHWTAFAMGAHLGKEYAQAIQILDEYEKTMEIPEKPDFDTSEFVLYKAMVLEESGNLQGALDYFSKVEKSVLDKLFLKEKRAEILYKMGNLKEAEAVARELIQINPDHYQYHYQLHDILNFTAKDGNFTEQQINGLVSLYKELDAQHPKSDAIKRIPLQFLAGNVFQEHVTKYLQNGIRKGIPSLFVSLKFIYNNSNKVQTIETLIKSFIDSLQKTNKFPGQEALESPDAILWSKFYYAQHLNFLGDSTNALKFINEVIEHTPTLLEAYLIKGKIYKHGGDVEMTSIFFEKAREMDLADRYLNNKSCKYMIRTNQVDKALSTLALFTREGDDPDKYLTEMQCMWYLLESGANFAKQQEYGKALKKLTAIDKHFADIVEDQFDFHTYCLRKMTLRAYIKFLRYEDSVYSHKFFMNAAKSIVKCYMDVVDNPKKDDSKQQESDLDKMSPDERKKFLKKQRKEQLKKEEEEKEKQKATTTTTAAASKSQDKKKEVDKDPNGLALITVTDPLLAASKYLQPLHNVSCNDVELLSLGGYLYVRRKKYLLALRCVHRGLAVDKTNPQLHLLIANLFHAVQSETNLHDAVKQVFEEARANILSGKTLEEFNNQFRTQHASKSGLHRIAVARVMFLINPAKKQEAIQLITELHNPKGYAQLQECIEVDSVLKTVFKDENAAKEYRAKCAGFFPLAVAFMSDDKLKARKESMLALVPVKQQPSEETNNNNNSSHFV